VVAITRRGLAAHGLAALAAAMGAPAARAQASPRIIVATYPGLGTRSWRSIVTDPFSKQSGIATEVFETALPAAAIAQAEGRPQFNAAVIAAYQTPNLVKRGLLELFTPDDLPGIRRVPEKFWLRTPEGLLMGVPVYFALFGIAYSTDLVKPADFKSWNNLLDPQWKGQLSISRPNFLAAYDVNLYAHLNGGSEHNIQPGLDFLRKLIPQALNVYNSMASIEAQLGRGEVAAAPFYANEVAMLRRHGTSEVGVVIPDEGGLVLPYLLVAPKGGPDPGAAKQLLNAILEPQYQAGFSQDSLTWPMNPATTLPAALVQEMGGSTDQILARNYSPDWWTIGSNLAENTKTIDALMHSVR